MLAFGKLSAKARWIRTTCLCERTQNGLKKVCVCLQCTIGRNISYTLKQKKKNNWEKTPRKHPSNQLQTGTSSVNSYETPNSNTLPLDLQEQVGTSLTSETGVAAGPHRAPFVWGKHARPTQQLKDCDWRDRKDANKLQWRSVQTLNSCLC